MNTDTLTERTDADGDRDARGRFVPGNTAAQGNSNAKALHEYRAALRDAAGPDDLKRVVTAIVAKATQGDVAAARIVLEYTLGKPKDMVEIEGGQPLVFNIISAKRREVLDAD